MTPDQVLARMGNQLSLRRRVAYVAAGLGGLIGSSLILLLWVTEPDLPARTQAAFGLLAVIGLAWAAFGAWAVTRRAPLFARDRVVAAGLGLGAWLVFAIGSLVITREPLLIATVVVLGAVAAGNLLVTRRARADLRRRRDSLLP